jgi:hypothetical protein
MNKRIGELIVVGVAIVLASCSSGGSGGGGGSTRIAGEFGTNGGVLAGEPGTALEGVRLEIPAGALAQSVELSVTEVRQPGAGEELPPGGVVIDIGPSGTTFAIPATLHLPYEDADGDGEVDGLGILEGDVIAMTLPDAASDWTGCELLGRNEVDNTVTVAVDHLSLFTTTSMPYLRTGPISIYYEPRAPTSPLSVAQYAMAKQTVLDAFYSGTAPPAPWKSLTDCLNWTFNETPSSSQADIVVRWASLSACPAGMTCGAHTIPSAPAGMGACGPKRSSFEITFNEDVVSLLHLSPALDPINGHDLFGLAAHEFAHTIGLPSECSGASGCQSHATQTNSVIDWDIAWGELQRTPTSEDTGFFHKHHPIAFHSFTPSGTAPTSQPIPEVSVELESLCDMEDLDASTVFMELVDSNGVRTSVPPNQLSTTPNGATRLTVSYMPAPNLTPGNYCVRVGGADVLGRSAETYWTFVTAGPSIVGTYVGSGIASNTGCQDPSINTTFATGITVDITSQSGSSFQGATTVTLNYAGYTFSGVDTLSGTVSPTGVISGTINGQFGATLHQGTFSGTVTSQVLTYSFTTTDTYGDTCTTTGSISTVKQ